MARVDRNRSSTPLACATTYAPQRSSWLPKSPCATSGRRQDESDSPRNRTPRRRCARFSSSCYCCSSLSASWARRSRPGSGGSPDIVQSLAMSTSAREESRARLPDSFAKKASRLPAVTNRERRRLTVALGSDDLGHAGGDSVLFSNRTSETRGLRRTGSRHSPRPPLLRIYCGTAGRRRHRAGPSACPDPRCCD